MPDFYDRQVAMKKQDYHFDLPNNLIAKFPLPERSASRLLTYNRKDEIYGHHQFRDLPALLQSGDLLVMNDSKVLPARLYGKKITGGKIELLVERILEEGFFLAHIKSSKPLKNDAKIFLDNNSVIEIRGRKEDLFICQAQENLYELLQSVGHMPLPPYMERDDQLSDKERYQTVYARHDGSIAAPTAGLHFDQMMLEQLKKAGIQTATVTLHVGAGTFKPVRCENILEHTMHSEQFVINEALCEAVRTTKERGNRVIAVGTTALRALESSAENGQIYPCNRETNIFIYPGYRFQICDGLITNFHLPESTLLMLVSAFIGYSQTKQLYQEAISQEYRFFSYGDTSLLL